MQCNFAQLVSHAAKTRPLVAGTIVGSGTIANEDTSKGASCFAEQRVVETLRDGKPSTPFMSFGDVVRIEMLDAAGNSIFGAIEQSIEQAARPRAWRRPWRSRPRTASCVTPTGEPAPPTACASVWS